MIYAGTDITTFGHMGNQEIAERTWREILRAMYTPTIADVIRRREEEEKGGQ